MGRYRAPPQVNGEALKAARGSLSLFDIVIVLENRGSFDSLARLSCSQRFMHSNSLGIGLRQTLCDWNELNSTARKSMLREPYASHDFVARLRIHDRADHDIYAQACAMVGSI
jgi:hypothetical protein